MESNIQQIFMGGSLRSMPKGQIVIYEGDPIKHLYYIVSGYIKVYSILASGNERIIFIYGPGDIFPITSYLSGSGATRYFYECMSKVEVRLIEPDYLKDKVRGNLELGEALMAYADNISQQFIQRIDILSVNDAKRKVIALLSFLVDKTSQPGSEGQLGLSLTTQNIADMCGLTRETTAKKLSSLRREGLVVTTKPLVVNVEKLEKLKSRLAIPAGHTRLP